MTARYQITQKAFIAPHTLLAGSIIEATGEPSLTWVPLNPEAEAAMDALYNKEYTYTNEKGEVVKTKPHLNKRPTGEDAPEPAERPTVELISAPTVDISQSISLAESQFSRAEPDLVPRGDGTSGLRSAEVAAPAGVKSDVPAAKPGEASDDGSVVVVAPSTGGLLG